MKTRALITLLILAILLHPVLIRAQWTTNGVVICNAQGGQANPSITSDGAGGAIVMWSDARNDTLTDIYAQRINAAGVAQWTANGIAICTAIGNQAFPVIVPDGVGGAIVAWQDARDDTLNDIYAQRVNAGGITQWTTDGVVVCNAVELHLSPVIVSDEAGGAIVAWFDGRGGGDIYAQRINDSGVAQWTPNGVAVCDAPGQQYNATIVSDAAGGAILSWEDYRSSGADVNAQRINAAGVVQWTSDGVAVCSAANSQEYPTLVSDGAGGAIVTWHDRRSNPNYDIYAQRINAVGVAQWATDGLTICNAATSLKFRPRIASDGAGGAIITWSDFQPYAQRINAAGVVQWTVNGVALSNNERERLAIGIVSDGAAGAIVVWEEAPFFEYDIDAQHISASGTPLWSADGAAFCTAPGHQYQAATMSDGAGGAIATWQDYRSGTQSDIYALRLGPGGLIPTGVGNTPSISVMRVTPNYPNPFSGMTTLDLSIPASGEVRVDVFDVAGRRVRAIEPGRMNAGSKQMSFNGLDDDGKPLPSGVYFYRVTLNGSTVTRKMVIKR